jgi:hypothetical protein
MADETADKSMVGRPRWAIILVFLSLLATPGIYMLTPWNGDPAEGPRLSFASLEYIRSYPGALRTFFQGHFGLRREVIQFRAMAEIEALGSSSTHKVVMGRDHWLYFADDGSLSSYRHTEPLSEEKLALWAKRLEIRRRVCAERGAAFYLLIVPDKHTIYPEHMPKGYAPLHGPSRLDQLKAYLKAHTSVELIDLRGVLLAAKPTIQLYQSADTHWNDFGAWVGTSEVLRVLGRSDPRVKPTPLSAFTLSHHIVADTDLGDMLLAPQLFREDHLDLIPRVPPPPLHDIDQFNKYSEQPGANLPRGIMFYDSFGIAMMPLLSPHFSRIRYTNILFFDQSKVFEDHPNIVISEFVERALSREVQVDNAPGE